MPKYLLRRFAEMLITLFLIATATFFLLEAVPGDPLTERASKLSPTVKENLYKRYGLDKPMMERYVITMKGICKGEFGESVVYAGQTVQKLIHDRLPVSARLGIQQVLVGITIGLLLGILAAMRRGSFWDYMVIALSVLLISIPNLIFGLMLQKIFAGNLKVLPLKPRTDYPPPYPSELVYPGYHTASDVGCHVYHRLLLHREHLFHPGNRTVLCDGGQ